MCFWSPSLTFHQWADGSHWEASMWSPLGLRWSWSGNRHLAFFSLGFFFVLVLFNRSSLNHIIQPRGPTTATVNENEELPDGEKSETSQITTTAEPDDQHLTLAELREAAIEALRSCSMCAPHRSAAYWHIWFSIFFQLNPNCTGAPG